MLNYQRVTINDSGLTVIDAVDSIVKLAAINARVTRTINRTIPRMNISIFIGVLLKTIPRKMVFNPS